MSYSFSIKAASKTDTKAEVEKKFDEVIAGQECHSHDKAAALASVSSALDLLTDDPNYGVNVSVSGSLSWLQSDPKEFHAVSISVHAHLQKNAAAEEKN